MARHKGKEGSVKADTNAVGEVRSFELTITANTADASTMGNDWTDTDCTQKSWNGTLTVFYDPADAGQTPLVAGATVALELYALPDTSGNQYFSGNALITEVGTPASHDGLIEQTIQFQGKGALATQTVS